MGLRTNKTGPWGPVLSILSVSVMRCLGSRVNLWRVELPAISMSSAQGVHPQDWGQGQLKGRERWLQPPAPLLSAMGLSSPPPSVPAGSAGLCARYPRPEASVSPKHELVLPPPAVTGSAEIRAAVAGAAWHPHPSPDREGLALCWSPGLRGRAAVESQHAQGCWHYR